MEDTFEEKLRRYAHLVVRSGCNLQEGQELYVGADISQVRFVRLVVAEAYAAGASDVIVRWGDEAIGRMHYENRPLEAFEKYPDWQALLQNGFARRGGAMLFIDSDDPSAFAGVDQAKMVAFQKAAHEACRDWRDGMDFGRNVWCIVGAASPAWARHVFPELPEAEATAKLWDAIFATVRVDTPDPVAAWDAHRRSFLERRAWLNGQHFDALHYTAANGTDFTVGLTPGSMWEGGGSVTVGGTYFFPNMPTEECFTSPDRSRADGKVVAAMPLNHNGSLVEGFSITFENGRVVDYSAEKGYDVLKGIIETDEGSHHLGEVALIPSTSPIRQTGILFLNTLFDENASCHLALGMGFPDCYEGGLEMDEESLLAAGINQSATHVDFMVGTEDLHIDGIRADGSTVAVFDGGVWAF